MSFWGYIFALIFTVALVAGFIFIRKIWKFCTEKSFGLLLCLFAFVFTVFVILFVLYIFPIIRELYELIDTQFYFVNVFEDSFQRVSLSVGGSITLSIALLGVILTLIRSTLNRQQNNTDVQKIVAEQISRAIDQIGGYKQNNDGSSHEPNIEARVGGIYSLERIAQDSARDYKKIMDILCAYVRVTASKKQNLQRKTEDTREDTQAAIDVLGTKKSNLLEKRNEFRVNLEDCNLSGYRFSELDFNTYTDSKSGTIFDDSLFNNVQFHRTDLSYVSFDRATLTGADFEYAIFKDTRVAGVDLRKTKNLTQDKVNEMIGDEDTEVPLGIKRPQHWPPLKPKKS